MYIEQGSLSLAAAAAAAAAAAVHKLHHLATRHEAATNPRHELLVQGMTLCTGSLEAEHNRLAIGNGIHFCLDGSEDRNNLLVGENISSGGVAHHNSIHISGEVNKHDHSLLVDFNINCLVVVDAERMVVFSIRDEVLVDVHDVSPLVEGWGQIPGVPPCGTVLINNTRCAQAKKQYKRA